MIENDWIAAVLGGVVVTGLLLGTWAIWGRGWIKDTVRSVIKENADEIKANNDLLGWGDGVDHERHPEGIAPEDADSPDVDEDGDDDDE